MATLAHDARPAPGEPQFFFKMACAQAAVLVAGFSLHLVAGRSSFAVPLIYHVHAFVFFGWTALFVAQTGLMASGNAALHRRLGWLAALWVPLMVVVGVLMTVASLRRTGGPFFFDANEFLISNPLGLIAFAALVGAAIVMRRRSDWHRRLMIGAMASIMGPGFGRLIPSPFLVPWSWEITNAMAVIFFAVGMLRDRRVLGRVHPAWYWGLAAAIGWVALGQVLAYSDWGIALTRQVMAGYPGAARPMEAYLP